MRAWISMYCSCPVNLVLVAYVRLSVHRRYTKAPLVDIIETPLSGMMFFIILEKTQQKDVILFALFSRGHACKAWAEICQSQQVIPEVVLSYCS